MESFQAVLQQIKALPQQPDLLLLTGDLSQDGKHESYRLVQEWLAPLGIPAYWVPGNHDDPTVMAEVLHQPPISPDKTFEAGGWQFLLMNSRVPGCVHGQLSAESLDWLDRELYRAAPLPTLISFHHPPFLVESDWLDSSTLQNSEALLALIDRHPHVKLVVFGHIHQEFSCRRHNVHYLGTPSTCIQFEPKSHHFALDQQTPGYRLITLYPDGSWDTRVERSTYTYQPNLAATGY
jgi:Icc protein